MLDGRAFFCLLPFLRFILNSRMHWQKITVVGVGLLGGSLALAVQRGGLAGALAGYVRRPESIAECRAADVLVEDIGTDLTRAVEGADLVVLCTPIGQMREVAERLLPAIVPGALVTDVGSVKAAVVQELEPLLAKAGAHFVGSHPMAGSEKTGVAHARADLFENAVCAITPTARSDSGSVKKLEGFWKSVGARPLKMTPDLHDDLVSRSSHLPHVAAAELANYVLSPVHPREQVQLCATGFRDMTRVAAGSTEMWRDICLANRKNLARVLGVFIEDLQEFRLAVEEGDRKAIEEFFDNARQRRQAWCGEMASPSSE